MLHLIEAAAARWPRTVFLFDSSPLLLTSESRALAQVVGQIVLVVRAGVTPRGGVREALGYLGTSRPVGIVLNESDEAAPSGYYYRNSAYATYGRNPA
jgi:Mrp family chromosome partitioning ATPase